MRIHVTYAGVDNLGLQERKYLARENDETVLAPEISKGLVGQYWHWTESFSELGSDDTQAAIDDDTTIALVCLAEGDGIAACLGRCQDFLDGHSRYGSRSVVLVVSHKALEQSDAQLIPEGKDHAFLVIRAATKAGHPLAPTSLGRAIKPHMSYIAENQGANPSVGWGLLLVDGNGRFLMGRRRSHPEPNKIGTVGGSFERGKPLDEMLKLTLRNRISNPHELEVSLGPLLSCSNMSNGYHHYVDMTFLGYTESRISNAWTLNDHDPVENNRHGFTVSEVLKFYRAGELFTPVEYAFESFCRRVLSKAVKGVQRVTHAPRLRGRGDLPLPTDLRDRDVLTAIAAAAEHWQGSELPFFERVGEEA